MAKGAYIGVGGVAKKVKKMYIGIGGVARKVKKAYIGVNNVARLFWSDGLPNEMLMVIDASSGTPGSPTIRKYTDLNFSSFQSLGSPGGTYAQYTMAYDYRINKFIVIDAYNKKAYYLLPASSAFTAFSLSGNTSLLANQTAQLVIDSSTNNRIIASYFTGSSSNSLENAYSYVISEGTMTLSSLKSSVKPGFNTDSTYSLEKINGYSTYLRSSSTGSGPGIRYFANLLYATEPDGTYTSKQLNTDGTSSVVFSAISVGKRSCLRYVNGYYYYQIAYSTSVQLYRGTSLSNLTLYKTASSIYNNISVIGNKFYYFSSNGVYCLDLNATNPDFVKISSTNTFPNVSTNVINTDPRRHYWDDEAYYAVLVLSNETSGVRLFRTTNGYTFTDLSGYLTMFQSIAKSRSSECYL